MSEVGAKPAQTATAPSPVPFSVLVLAQLPPPVHGVTAMTIRIKALLDEIDGVTVEHAWSGSAASLADIDSKSLGKLLEFAGLNLRLLGRWLSGRRCDMVYLTFVPWSHAAIRDALVAWWGKRLGRRTLVHLHGEGLEEIAAGQTLKARLVRPLIAGTELIAITVRASEIAEASGLFARIIRLPNAVADPGWHPSAAVAGTPLRLGFLGNLDPRKGVLRFVDIVAALVAAGLPVRGGIAGASTRHLTVEALRETIAGRGLAQSIVAHGPLHGGDKDCFLASLDVLVYLSRHDHAPLVLLEALAAGVVPIVLDTGGVAELAGPAFKSHVLPRDLPDDALTARIAEIVRAYADHPASLAVDRQRARDRFETEYTETAFRHRWRQLLSQSPPRPAPPPPAYTPSAASVRTALPSRVKSPFFALTRAIHARLLSRPLPDRIAIYFHALEAADRLALSDCVTTLRGLGYRTVSFDDYVDPATSGKLLNISFDDNYRSWHTALDLLDRLSLRATFFTNSLPFRDRCDPVLVADYFERLGHAGERQTLSGPELREIADAGHEIGCHSHSHSLLAKLPPDRWATEILDSKRILEHLTGRPVRHFSWPYGMPRHVTGAIQDYCLSVGFRSITGATPGLLHAGAGNRRNVPRTAWLAGCSAEDNLVNLAIDGRLFTAATGLSVIG